MKRLSVLIINVKHVLCVGCEGCPEITTGHWASGSAREAETLQVKGATLRC